MKLNQKIKIIFTLLFCIATLHGQTPTKAELYKQQVKNLALKAVRTRAMFHATRYASRLMHGNAFTFNQIAGDAIHHSNKIQTNKIAIIRDNKGTIIAIHDGKKTPLALGSIPTTQIDIKTLIDVLCSQVNLKKPIEILTLNEQWEIDTAGLSRLLQENNNIIQLKYPTPDMASPSMVDVIRAVHALETRDSRAAQLCLVHCKAGRGRSATIMAAYIAHLLHQAEQPINVEQIIAYLVKCRAQVHINTKQKELLTEFIAQLQEAGSLAQLYEKNSDAIAKREIELAQK